MDIKFVKFIVKIVQHKQTRALGPEILKAPKGPIFLKTNSLAIFYVKIVFY